MYVRMKALMDEEGLPYGRRTHTFNSRLAQELGKWADSRPGGEAIHDALFRAYFVDAKNIGQREVLAGIAEQLGLPADEATDVLLSRSFKDAVDDDWKRCATFGINAVPTFLAGRYLMVGAQPYDQMERLVQHALEAAQTAQTP